MSSHYTPRNIERFWSKVDTRGDCWLWIATKLPKGYGLFRCQGKLHKAHRFVWELTYGEIPDKLFVLHHCDTPSCVNPTHLFLGTHQENMADCVNKGRSRTQKHPEQQRGERNGRAKLTEAQVREIRQAYATGNITQKALARQFCVSQDTIWSALKADKWKHIPGNPASNTANNSMRLDVGRVREIRRLYAIGVKQPDLAQQFGVRQGTISCIVRRVTWKHVSQDDPELEFSPPSV